MFVHPPLELSQYQFKSGIVSIPFKYLAIFGYGYMVAPVIIFCLTWLRWYIGIPASLVLLVGLYMLIRNEYWKEEEYLIIPIVPVMIACIGLAIWVMYSGLGGLFFQTSDNHWRNAVFHDLVTYPWPVVYPETGNALIYYLMFWIVPALMGKIGGWAFANISLLVWGILGIWLVFLFVLQIIKPRKLWHITVITLLFIGWSGENLIGMMISKLFDLCIHPLAFGSFEGWLDFTRNGYDCSYLYRSNIDALCQVYNQTIVPWLATVIMLHKPKTCLFAFLGLVVLPYGPIPFIGMLPFFIVFFIKENIPYIKEGKWKKVFATIFSIQNIAASITIFPIMLFFFSINISASTGADGQFISLFVPLEAFDIPRILTLLLFYLMEFGIFSLLIYPKYKRTLLFSCVIVSLILIPNFKIGSIRDFCMNASLSALFILMIMVAKYIIDEYQPQLEFKFACRYIGLLLMVVISFTTLIGDCIVKCQIMDEMQVFPYVANDIGTFADKNIGDVAWLENFLVPNPQETTFFKYLAK